MMKKSSNGRYYEHHFPDSVPVGGFNVRCTFFALINDIVYRQHERAEAYVGHCGVTLALFELAGRCPNFEDLPSWSSHLDVLSRHDFSSRRFTFLEGFSGFYALKAVATEGKVGVDELQRIGWEKITAEPPGECELLYGRAGYLYSLLFVRKYLGRPELFGDLIKELSRQILNQGLRGDSLVWEWHGKPYLGAVHGTAGILYTLLSCDVTEIQSIYDNISPLICNTINQVLTSFSHNTVETCNIFSSVKKTDSDSLVHFCHGATGWVPLLLKIFTMRVMFEYSFCDMCLNAARRCGESVWRRGLLCTKGPGLCHGVGGSICALVDLYTATGEQLWLNRAQQFCLMLVERLEELSPNADHPHSLFEGRAGAMYALGIVQALSEGASRQQICMTGPDRWSSCFPGLGL